MQVNLVYPPKIQAIQKLFHALEMMSLGNVERLPEIHVQTAVTGFIYYRGDYAVLVEGTSQGAIRLFYRYLGRQEGWKTQPHISKGAESIIEWLINHKAEFDGTN